MAKSKNTLVSDFVDRKTFDYKMGICNLNFQLRTDIKQELKDFVEILKKALVDVQAELDKKKS